MENRDKPAFPASTTTQDPVTGGALNHLGISKREYFAAQALIGLLSNSDPDNVPMDSEQVAKVAVNHADAIVKLLS